MSTLLLLYYVLLLPLHISQTFSTPLNTLVILNDLFQNITSNYLITKLDTELSELKKSLNVEVVQLRTEFQELKNTLQQQQEDVTASLRNLGLQDNPSDDAKEAQEPKVDAEDQEVHASVEEDIVKKDEN
ncbi:CAP-Gly domain-containing linker protein [Salix suchowensis]|nr:CAP-Gly domain-containing linker protein [Salix suchowensis]